MVQDVHSAQLKERLHDLRSKVRSSTPPRILLPEMLRYLSDLKDTCPVFPHLRSFTPEVQRTNQGECEPRPNTAPSNMEQRSDWTPVTVDTTPNVNKRINLMASRKRLSFLSTPTSRHSYRSPVKNQSNIYKANIPSNNTITPRSIFTDVSQGRRVDTKIPGPMKTSGYSRSIDSNRHKDTDLKPASYRARVSSCKEMSTSRPTLGSPSRVSKPGHLTPDKVSGRTVTNSKKSSAFGATPPRPRRPNISSPMSHRPACHNDITSANRSTPQKLLRPNSRRSHVGKGSPVCKIPSPALTPRRRRKSSAAAIRFPDARKSHVTRENVVSKIPRLAFSPRRVGKSSACNSRVPTAAHASTSNSTKTT